MVPFPKNEKMTRSRFSKQSDDLLQARSPCCMSLLSSRSCSVGKPIKLQYLTRFFTIIHTRHSDNDRLPQEPPRINSQPLVGRPTLASVVLAMVASKRLSIDNRSATGTTSAFGWIRDSMVTRFEQVGRSFGTSESWETRMQEIAPLMSLHTLAHTTIGSRFILHSTFIDRHACTEKSKRVLKPT